MHRNVFFLNLICSFERSILIPTQRQQIEQIILSSEFSKASSVTGFEILFHSRAYNTIHIQDLLHQQQEHRLLFLHRTVSGSKNWRLTLRNWKIWNTSFNAQVSVLLSCNEDPKTIHHHRTHVSKWDLLTASAIKKKTFNRSCKIFEKNTLAILGRWMDPSELYIVWLGEKTSGVLP